MAQSKYYAASESSYSYVQRKLVTLIVLFYSFMKEKKSVKKL